MVGQEAEMGQKERVCLLLTLEKPHLLKILQYPQPADLELAGHSEFKHRSLLGSISRLSQYRCCEVTSTQEHALQWASTSSIGVTQEHLRQPCRSMFDHIPGTLDPVQVT